MTHYSSQCQVSPFNNIVKQTIIKSIRLTSTTILSLSIGLSIGLTLAHASEQPPANTPSNRPVTFMDTLTPEQAQAYVGFQTDADIIRLHHLKYWVDAIEIYHDKTGKYPFQGESDNRLLTLVATPRQQQYTYQMRGTTHKSMQEFVALLEEGIGQSIEEYYDPQYAPDAKPNYYIYMIDGDRYYFAIHTHQSYPFSRHVRPYYNKVEVSNIYSEDSPHILTSEMLFDSDAYKDASHQPLENIEFFKQREALTLHATKE